MDNLIEPAWLADRLAEPDLVILDASWYMPADNRDPEKEYEAGHIPGACRFDFDGKIRDSASGLPHMMPGPDAFQAAVRELGVCGNSRIVIYDGAGIFAAPRAWWMFKAMGHEKVAVLNGGMPAWRAAGFPVAQGREAPAASGDFVARPAPGRIADAAKVKSALDAGSHEVIDARSAPRFTGEQPEPRAGLRSGHMPGARNLPFNRLIADGAFRRPEQIAASFREAGLVGCKPVIASCGSGVTASVLALGAELAGLEPVAVYDGSWSEWGQETRQDLPVVKGPAQ